MSSSTRRHIALSKIRFKETFCTNSDASNSKNEVRSDHNMMKVNRTIAFVYVTWHKNLLRGIGKKEIVLFRLHLLYSFLEDNGSTSTTEYKFKLWF